MLIVIQLSDLEVNTYMFRKYWVLNVFIFLFIVYLPDNLLKNHGCPFHFPLVKSVQYRVFFALF